MAKQKACPGCAKLRLALESAALWISRHPSFGVPDKALNKRICGALFGRHPGGHVK